MSRTTPVPVRIAPPPASWTEQARTVRRPVRSGAKDRPIAAMVLGILSLVVNPLFLPSLIGILYGAGSLRAGTERRAQAIVGIVCGSIGAASGAVGIVLFVLVQLALPGIAADRLERSITTTSARSGTTLTDVTCPPVGSLDPGTAVTCTATDARVGAVTIEVRVGADGRTTFQEARSS